MSKRKDVELQVNDKKKAKYSIISRRKHRQDSLVVGDLTFAGVLNIKYLGKNINQQTNSHKKINR